MTSNTKLSDPAGVLDSLGAYVYTKDREGQYRYANRPVLELFGCTLEDVIGKDDSAFFDLERSRDLRDNDDRVMADGVQVSTREVDIIRETNQERDYWTVKTPIRDEAGEVIGLVGISVDITP